MRSVITCCTKSLKGADRPVGQCWSTLIGWWLGAFSAGNWYLHGALIASAAPGAFVLHRRVPWRLALGSVLGGVALGYGSRLAGGCNIGAHFSGIASFSLHGWLWGVLALAGTFVGLRMRPLFGLSNPKPADSIC